MTSHLIVIYKNKLMTQAYCRMNSVAYNRKKNYKYKNMYLSLSTLKEPKRSAADAKF